MKFDYGFDLHGEELAVVGGLIAAVLVVYLLILAFSVVSYVLQALGMYKIAKRRGLHHPWLAWIPVGNMWLLGCISDQYQYVVKGRVRSRRKTLLWLTVGMMAAAVVLNIFSIAALAAGSNSAQAAPAVGGVLVMLLLGLAVLVICVIAVVLQYMATYDMFVSCDPNNAVLYLVLSIFVNVTMPFFIFACRNKDLGMPRRRPVQPAPQNMPEAEPAPEETCEGENVQPDEEATEETETTEES